ncbi:MAG TPA: polysaccharide deacetylase family protein [Nitrospiraceae bacterium]|nr:polysaccharide deacetylase family protein [Nitrospiraceae bacterium]
MLKKAANCVLGSNQSSTYPYGKGRVLARLGRADVIRYASGFVSPAALLDSFFEHALARFCLIIITIAFSLGLSATSQAEVIREGPRGCKAVALTFDMCPVREGSGYDEPLVRTLIEKRIPATFFLSGRWIMKHDAEVKALLGVPFFEVGTHGHVHAHLPELDEEQQRREILGPVTMLRSTYGRTVRLFRPPYGEYNEATIHLAEILGLRFILWNVVSGDPDSHLSEAEIVRTIKSRARSGNIIVMHANGKGRHTRAVVDDLYDDMIVRQEYQAVTISALLNECVSPHAYDGRSSDH